MFRRPVGWRYESYRHYLAAKGIRSAKGMRKYRDGNLQIAGEKFEFRHLKKLGEGSDRVVYEIPGKKVVKVATTARGLAQNDIEGTEKFDVPKVSERGQDYVVVEEEHIGNKKEIEKRLEPLQGFTREDLERRNPKLMAELKKLGIEDIRKFDVAWGDIVKPSSWTMEHGKLKLLDAGALVEDSSVKHHEFDASHPRYVQEWKKVLAHRRVVRDIRRDPYARQAL